MSCSILLRILTRYKLWSFSFSDKKRLTAYLVYTKRKNNQAVKNVSWIVFTQARPTTDSHVQMSIMNKSTMTNNSK